jgi:hypothetical protein
LSVGSIIALSGLSEILVFSPFAFTATGFAKISVPFSNYTLHLSPEISKT